MTAPFVVGIGGSTRPDSTSDAMLRSALRIAAELGADTDHFHPGELDLPLYPVHTTERTEDARRWLDAAARADALIVATPGYHGTISASVKNMLDYLDDFKPTYLDGRAVGCIACSFGDQAAPQALTALRSVVHALRAWPTPLGVTVSGYYPTAVDGAGAISDPALLQRLQLMCEQVVTFARVWPRGRAIQN